MSASGFVKRLRAISSRREIEKVARFFDGDGKGNRIMGVPIGKVFPVAKEYVHASMADVETLLESPYYEVRMGAVSIMDFQARAKSTSPAQRKALFDLYIRRHDRINNWDLVDRAAPHVVGRYLIDKPRSVLYKLAKARDPWKRRTAIVSTGYFIRSGEVDDTFRIAELLVKDKHELVQKAVGSWVREAGKRDESRLLRFLDKHASGMPRVMLRYAVEKLDRKTREQYMRTAAVQSMSRSRNERVAERRVDPSSIAPGTPSR
jgi:hypothetical protein